MCDDRRRGWSGDYEGHPQASRRGWEGRRSEGRYDDDDRGYRSRGRYEDDDYDDRRGSRGRSSEKAEAGTAIRVAIPRLPAWVGRSGGRAVVGAEGRRRNRPALLNLQSPSALSFRGSEPLL